MYVKKIAVVLSFFLFCAAAFALSPEELVQKVNDNFLRIGDAQGEIDLDVGLQLLGCGGLQRQKGAFFYKAPDKLKITLNGDTYYLRGNSIRKVDREHKRYYVRLLYVPDFSVGFTPRLISHNFTLKLIKEDTAEAWLEGLPKPGVLKNVKRVVFKIDTRENLLREMELFLRQNITGRVKIDYGRFGGLSAPTATHGRSALELNNGLLVGLLFNLKGEKIRLNSGIPDRVFDPGF